MMEPERSANPENVRVLATVVVQAPAIRAQE